MNPILGKYVPLNTIIHKIDSRIKFFGLVLIMVIVFLPYGNYTSRFIVLGILTLLIGITMILGKVSFSTFFSSLKMMWMMFIFLTIFMFFIPPSNGQHVLYAFPNGYTLYYDGLLQVLFVMLRLVLMVALTIILTSTTSSVDITYALEWYLTPLKLIKFPIQIISLTISLALRFIPTLLNESRRIMNAQKSRGVDYNKGFLISKIRSITTLIIPLLVSCFTKSDELAIAMDSRGYDPYGKRSKYRELKFKWSDLFSFLFIVIIGACFITLSCFIQNVPGMNDLINYFFGVATW